MDRLRDRLARFTLLLGAVAWVLGWSASLVHQSVTVHVECEVHGDLVDVGHQGFVAADAHDVAKSLAPADDHDHDCSLHALGVARVPLVHGPVAQVDRIVRVDEPFPALNAPRGPPLRYAPKTSPPV